MNRRLTFVFVGVFGLVSFCLIAARNPNGEPGTRRRGIIQTAEHAAPDAPSWKNPPPFKYDGFTFTRIRYSSKGLLRSNGLYLGGRGSRFGDVRWSIDYPDADINLAFRLQQLTSLKADRDSTIIELTDPELARYPFIYIVEPGDLGFEDDEVPILRNYLLNGGFLMFDDFWGEAEWENMADEMHRIFPDKEFVDLPADHPIFKGIFPLEKNRLQTPNVRVGERSKDTGVTWEREDAKEVHFRGLYDDKGRLMVLACHNTDNGDGWEREGEYEYFFHEFSEKKNYPLAINIIFYVMTH